MTVTLSGFDDLAAKLRSIAPTLRKSVIRNSLAAGARLVRDEARANTPVLPASGAMRAPYRKSGTVKKAISVRTSKRDRRAGNVGVFVNVKPLPGPKYKKMTSTIRGVTVRRYKLIRASQRGAKNPNDPYYWRWLEFGWNPHGGRKRTTREKSAHRKLQGKRVAGIGFLRSGVRRLPDALLVFQRSLTAWIEKTNTSGKVNP